MSAASWVAVFAIGLYAGCMFIDLLFQAAEGVCWGEL